MTLFITKKEPEASAILDPPFWIILTQFILFKTGKNRGIFNSIHSLIGTISNIMLIVILELRPSIMVGRFRYDH